MPNEPILYLIVGLWVVGNMAVAATLFLISILLSISIIMENIDKS